MKITSLIALLSLFASLGLRAQVVNQPGGNGSSGSGTVTSIATSCGVSGGTITTAGTVTGSIAVDSQTGAGAFAIPSTDCGKLVARNQAGAVSDTLAQAGGSFRSQWYVQYQCSGAGGCTITPATSTIDGALSLTLTQNQGVLIVSDGTNYFTQRGVGSTNAGTVTSVATNNGLTGGPITATGTVGLAAIANNAALCNNSGGSAVPTSANCTVTGTGNVVLANSPVFSTIVEVNANAATLPSPESGAVLQLGGANSASARAEVDAFGGSAFFTAQRADGTAASPTTLQSGDQIGGFNSRGWDGSAWSASGITASSSLSARRRSSSVAAWASSLAFTSDTNCSAVFRRLSMTSCSAWAFSTAR